MRKTTSIHLKKTVYAVLLLPLFLIFSCEKENIPAPSDFTKDKREQLGELIQVAIASDPVSFPMLPKSAPYDSAYWYIQKLYNQATNALKVDGVSPADNRWDTSREWPVTILDQEDEKVAFIIPGGHLYISTGLLKSLEKEYELYYILAFEAILMNDRYLLNRMINHFNTTNLNNLLLGVPPTDTQPTLLDIANSMAWIDFDEDRVQEIDEKAISLVCKTSIFDRLGIISIMNLLDEDDTKWMQTRASYEFRSQIDYIANIPVDTNDDCGSFKTNGGYQDYVLDRL